METKGRVREKKMGTRHMGGGGGGEEKGKEGGVEGVRCDLGRLTGVCVGIRRDCWSATFVPAQCPPLATPSCPLPPYASVGTLKHQLALRAGASAGTRVRGAEHTEAWRMILAL